MYYIFVKDIKHSDKFYDLGCGNGAILISVAARTGARCVGAELDTVLCEVGAVSGQYIIYR